MSNIKIEESDFLGKSAQMNFIDGEFRFTKTSISSKLDVITSREIKTLNRQRASKVSGTNTNVFQTHFIGGPIIAMFMSLFGFAAAAKKQDRRIVVHLKNGKFFRGMTDLDTFFEVQMRGWILKMMLRQYK